MFIIFFEKKSNGRKKNDYWCVLNLKLVLDWVRLRADIDNTRGSSKCIDVIFSLTIVYSRGRLRT